MTRHRDLIEGSNCDGELKYLVMRYSSDVFWKIYQCLKCKKFVYTVEGMRHWWNFERDSMIERI